MRATSTLAATPGSRWYGQRFPQEAVAAQGQRLQRRDQRLATSSVDKHDDVVVWFVSGRHDEINDGGNNGRDCDDVVAMMKDDNDGMP